jgi:hypothetical protein
MPPDVVVSNSRLPFPPNYGLDEEYAATIYSVERRKIPI